MNYENTLVILIIESDSKFYLNFKNWIRILNMELEFWIMIWADRNLEQYTVDR